MDPNLRNTLVVIIMGAVPCVTLVAFIAAIIRNVPKNKRKKKKK